MHSYRNLIPDWNAYRNSILDWNAYRNPIPDWNAYHNLIPDWNAYRNPIPDWNAYLNKFPTRMQSHLSTLPCHQSKEAAAQEIFANQKEGRLRLQGQSLWRKMYMRQDQVSKS